MADVGAKAPEHKEANHVIDDGLQERRTVAQAKEQRDGKAEQHEIAGREEPAQDMTIFGFEIVLHGAHPEVSGLDIGRSVHLPCSRYARANTSSDQLPTK